MNIIALAIFFAFVYGFAMAEARDDYGQIRRNENINHVRQWIFRAVIVGGVALILWALTPLSFLPLWGAGGFLFSALFRWKLNELRGLDWRYIAPWSNVYDRVMFAITHPRRWRVWTSALRMSIERDYYFDLDEKGAIHRAGKVAYLIEAIIVVASLITYYATA